MKTRYENKKTNYITLNLIILITRFINIFSIIIFLLFLLLNIRKFIISFFSSTIIYNFIEIIQIKNVYKEISFDKYEEK